MTPQVVKPSSVGDHAAENLVFIRQAMERSATFTTIPGAGGVAADEHLAVGRGEDGPVHEPVGHQDEATERARRVRHQPLHHPRGAALPA